GGVPGEGALQRHRGRLQHLAGGARRHDPDGGDVADRADARRPVAGVLPDGRGGGVARRGAHPARDQPPGAALSRPRPHPARSPPHFSGIAFFAVGNSFGTGTVTLPVAAHSVPRCTVSANPTHFIALTSWPIGVWNTRPLP